MRHQLYAGLFVALTGFAGGGLAFAQSTTSASTPRSYSIAAGELGNALNQLAVQSKLHIVYAPGLVRDKTAPAISGKQTWQQALQKMLAGTGLEWRLINETTVAIRKIKAEPGPASSSTARIPGEDRAVALPDILVIGHHSLNADIRRTANDAQPYVVFDREKLDTTQATTVEEFLRTHLPQNASFNGSQAQTTGTGAPYSSFNLRGLGSDQTLILVNGRRLPDLADQNMAPGQADINGIPLASIERIEVLPSSAGGIYGGNAVGGVINIILRSDYQGVDVKLTYGNSTDFKAANRRLDINGGLSFDGGRTGVTFGGSISGADTLRVRDRPDLVQKGMQLGYRNVSPYEGTGRPPLGRGVNIRSADGSDLVLAPQYGGTDLGSDVTHLPVGYGGVAGDDGALLVQNAGAFDLRIPEDLSGLKRGLQTAPEMRSFHVNVRRDFTEWLTMFVDYSRFENRGLSYSNNQLPVSASLAAGSVNNPFQQPVRVSFSNPTYWFPYEYESVTKPLSIGSIIRLPGDWALNAEYNKTWTSNSSSFYNAAIDVFGTYCGLQPTPGLVDCTGKPVLDPLQTPIDYDQYLFTEPTFVAGPYRSEFENPTLRASGPLFQLGGGKASLTMVLQREATKIRPAMNQVVDSLTRERSYVMFPGRSQRTDSGYAELVMPFVSRDNARPMLRELELRVAARHDRYLTESPPADASSMVAADPSEPFPAYERLKTRFDSTNFTFAGRYSPVKGVMLRASYATGFLPPNVVQLGSNTSVAPFGLGVPDPQRGNEIIDYSLVTTGGAGNLALRPEKSRSIVLGMVLTPIEGMRLSIDYTRIRKKDEIGGIPTDYLLSFPDLFPGRVVRDAPQAGDPEGYAGKIVSIDTSPINQLRSNFKAIDTQFDYEFKLAQAGKFRVYALASWQPDSSRQLIAGTPALNYSGNADGPLKWQGNAGIDWKVGKWGVNWNTQFYASYNVFPTVDVDTSRGAQRVEDAIALQGKRRVPSQAYSDLFASYDFSAARGLLSGLRVSAGIQNIFNRKPPVLAIQSYAQAGYSTYGDPRLRRFTVSVTKEF